MITSSEVRGAFKKYAENCKMLYISITIKYLYRKVLYSCPSISTIFLQDFTCIATIDFELQWDNKTPPPNLSRKEQQRRPSQNYEVNYLPFLGNNKLLNRVKNIATNTEILHK